MPKIRVLNITDCIDFIEKHKQEIIDGDYEIIMPTDIINTIDHKYVDFVVKYCPNSRKEFARHSSNHDILSYIYYNSRGGDNLWELATNPYTPIEILSLLSKINDACIRKSVAKNSMTPISILEILARDDDYFVRAGVAANHKAPLRILQMLINDCVQVLNELKKNPNFRY